MRIGARERAGLSPQVSCPGLLAARFSRSAPWVGLLQAACRRHTLSRAFCGFFLVRLTLSQVNKVIVRSGPFVEFRPATTLVARAVVVGGVGRLKAMAAMRSAVRMVSLGARAHGAVLVRTCQMTRTCVAVRGHGVFEQIRTLKSTPAASDPGQAVASAGGDAEIVPDFAPGEDVEMVVRK